MNDENGTLTNVILHTVFAGMWICLNYDSQSSSTCARKISRDTKENLAAQIYVNINELSWSADLRVALREGGDAPGRIGHQ